MRHAPMVTLVLIVIIATTSLLVSYSMINDNTETVPFYVGISFCGNTTTEAKLLIDRVKSYTNLFVLQSGLISKNETAINEICDYAVASELDIIVYFGWFDPDFPWQIPWLDMAKQRWGNHFLGVYYYDEPGGLQLDYNWARLFNRIRELNATRYQTFAPAIEGDNGSMDQLYSISAKMYTNALAADSGIKALKNRSIAAFTSDYALYWWDYLGGYDVLLAQFGWNNTLFQDIALVRGAARMQNKSWGAILTWKYDAPPYLDSGEQIYNQLCMAYEAGAKYVVIFNYPQIEDSAYGAMTDEHFEALEKFWNDIGLLSNMKVGSEVGRAETALVLPRNYGWGMRHPNDRLWYWGSDEISPQIWEISRKLLSQYELRLDIVYDDPEFSLTDKYARIYYWNETV